MSLIPSGSTILVIPIRPSLPTNLVHLHTRTQEQLELSTELFVVAFTLTLTLTHSLIRLFFVLCRWSVSFIRSINQFSPLLLNFMFLV